MLCHGSAQQRLQNVPSLLHAVPCCSSRMLKPARCSRCPTPAPCSTSWWRSTTPTTSWGGGGGGGVQTANRLVRMCCIRTTPTTSSRWVGGCSRSGQHCGCLLPLGRCRHCALLLLQLASSLSAQCNTPPSINRCCQFTLLNCLTSPTALRFLHSCHRRWWTRSARISDQLAAA